jgi:hypothetical protein
MAFWSENTLEPLRQYRWKIVFGGINAGTGIDTQSFALKKVDRPKAKVNEITHKYLNHFYYYPGRVEWEPINLTIAANVDTSKSLMEILKKAGYVFPKDLNVKNTLSKAGFAGGLGSSIDIINIDPAGAEQDKFTLQNPFFTSVQFGSLDYGSEEIVEVQCTLRYDAAVLKGVDTTVV